jgi:uncharacterized protein YuzE
MRQTKKKIYYDKKTDSLWINVQSGVENEHKEVSPGISIELGNNGELLGVEILNASKVLGSKLGLSAKTTKLSYTIAHQIKK